MSTLNLVSLGLALTVAVGDAASTTRPASPVGGGAPVVLETTQPAASQIRHRLVFSCREGTVTVFADRPCGEAPLRREIEVRTPAVAGRPPSTEPAPVKSATKPAPVDDDRPGREAAERCQRLRRAVDAVDDRMRAGYSAREAPRLWQRWRDAQQRLHEARC